MLDFEVKTKKHCVKITFKEWINDVIQTRKLKYIVTYYVHYLNHSKNKHVDAESIHNDGWDDLNISNRFGIITPIRHVSSLKQITPWNVSDS